MTVSYRTHVSGATLEKEGDWIGRKRWVLREEDLTIAEVLQDKGYRTGMVGGGWVSPIPQVNLTKKVLTTLLTTKEEHILLS